MRIRLTKDSDERHTLEIVRADDSRDAVELVTREALIHDLLHFAVESSLPTQQGFWGTLASGKMIADLNDRSGEAVRENLPTLYKVEGIVGVMTAVIDLPQDQAVSRLHWFSESQGLPPPDWCTETFVADVQAAMVSLRGRWKATPYGEPMEIDWPETS